MGSLSRKEVEQIASAQRWLLWTILALIALNVASIAAGPILDGAQLPPEAAALLGFGILGALFLLVVLQIVSVIRLCLAMKEGWTTVLYVIFQFVPCLSLILLLFLNGRATKKLQAAGIRVGLMGANSADLAKYQPQNRGTCSSCGEGIDPDDSQCPLCGAALEST